MMLQLLKMAKNTFSTASLASYGFRGHFIALWKKCHDFKSNVASTEKARIKQESQNQNLLGLASRVSN
jgi:hypothetical protein